MVDVDRMLKNVVSNGKVCLGAKQTKTAVTKGTAKMVVMAKNCPYTAEITTLGKEKKVPIYNYQLNSLNLGYACGKKFPVSVFAVLDEGESNIMHLVKKR
jgi:large subunit ribosomal protein L30e